MCAALCTGCEIGIEDVQIDEWIHSVIVQASSGKWKLWDAWARVPKHFSCHGIVVKCGGMYGVVVLMKYKWMVMYA